MEKMQNVGTKSAFMYFFNLKFSKKKLKIWTINCNISQKLIERL